MNAIISAGKWAAGEAWEKINVRAKWEEIKGLAKKPGYGLRFIVFAVVWECIEDIVFPLLAIYFGVPALVPFFLIMHFEIITWPTALWAFRMYDRKRGLIPWEPDRTAQSSNLRSVMKGVVYKLAVTGYYWAILREFGHSPKILLVFAALMAGFGFVHERIWHDSNYGIGDNGAGDNDHVFMKRVAAKTVTYCVVSTTILASLFKASFGGVHWLALIACQSLGMGLYFIFEAVWSRSKWGVTKIVRDSSAGVYRGKLSVGEIQAGDVAVITRDVHGSIYM